MAEFTTLDRLRVTLNPLLCCFASTSQQTTTTESSNQNWFNQSRPIYNSTSSNRKGKGRRLRGNWEDETERLERREEDLLSLHENQFDQQDQQEEEEFGGIDENRNYQEGKINGGGSSRWKKNGLDQRNETGLSRWTLLKSWWNSKSTGAIRLDEDDVVENNGFQDEQHFRDGEQDALELVDGNQHFNELELEEEEESRREAKAERKALRKEKRRRAKELGLTAEEFDEGQSGILEPDDNFQSNYLSSQKYVTRSHSRSSRSSGSTRTTETRNSDFVFLDKGKTIKETQNGSHGFNFTGVDNSPLLDVEVGDGEDLFGIPKPLINVKHGSNGSGSGGSKRQSRKSGSNDSGNSKKSNKESISIPYNFRDFLSPNPIESPLPTDSDISPSPSTESVYPLVTQPILKPFLTKRTSHKSTHSISTTSSGNGNRRKFRRDGLVEEEDLFSNGSENATGNKRWSGAAFSEGTIAVEEVDAYSHIGQLPGAA